MSSLGKWLTYLNVFVAVGLLTWSLSAYANQIDWMDQKTDSGTTKGQITLLKEEIDRLSKGISELQSSYQGRVAVVERTESTRDYRRVRYQDRIKQAKSGTFTEQVSMKGSVGDSVFTDLEVRGNPIPGGDNTPLRGLDTLKNDLDREVRTSREIFGGTQPFTPADWTNLDQVLSNPNDFNNRLGSLGITDLRKLHGQLSDRIESSDKAILKQKEILSNLRDEAVNLTTNRVSWEGKLQILERRQTQLQKELAKYNLGEGR